MSTAMQVVQAPIFVAPIPGYGGKLEGTITGLTPAAERYVSLYKDGATPQTSRSLVLLRTTKTKSSAWVFEHLEDAATYTLIAWDHTNAFDPVIVVGKVPEPM